MHIIEIYKSLQGESSFAGLPCVFVRLAGCNLRCAWCDSEYTFTGGRKMSDARAARRSPAPLALGRPGRSHRRRAHAAGARTRPISPPASRPGLRIQRQIQRQIKLSVLLETSGERPLELVPREVHKIVDVKCPGSGEHLRFRPENLATLTARDELKFVLASRQTTSTPATSSATHALESSSRRPHPLARLSQRRHRHALVAKIACSIPRSLAEWMLADNLNARLGLQIHKFIWEPQLKGV